MILLDTSGLLAAIDSRQRYHERCSQALNDATSPLLLSPFVLAELDYLLAKHVGSEAQSALLEEVARGAYRLEPFTPADVSAAKSVLDRYASLRIGLTDASLVVLANKYGIHEVLTLDERHFRALRIGGRKRFRILPADL